MLETLDHTIRIGSTPTFLYFDLYLYSAYAAHYVYFDVKQAALPRLWVVLHHFPGCSRRAEQSRVANLKMFNFKRELVRRAEALEVENFQRKIELSIVSALPV